MSLDLHTRTLLDHAKNPRRRGVVPGATLDATRVSPICGDRLRITARVVAGRIDDVAFAGEGCVVSQASASLMTDQLAGVPVEEAIARASRLEKFLAADSADPPPPDLPAAAALEVVRKYPTRVPCALLPWKTLAEALLPESTVREFLP